MRTFIDGLERVITAVMRWGVQHFPMPHRLRAALLEKRLVLEEMVKFGIAGLCATVVFFSVFEPLGLLYGFSWVTFTLANIPAVVVAYIISSKFVFENNSEYKTHTEFIMFFAMVAIAVFIGASALGVTELVIGRPLDGITANVVTILATVASWGVRFVFSRRVIFKSHLERPPVDVATEIAHVADELDEARLEPQTGTI